MPYTEFNKQRSSSSRRRRNEMLHLSLSFLFLASQISLMHALPAQLDPDPAAVQPSVVFPTAAPPATIPAFPEQSAAAGGGAACSLDLSGDIIARISASCSPRHRRPASRARCCPSLAAGLYSAAAVGTLSASVAALGNLPVLPDDSEACAGAAERAIARRGVELPRVNATCGAAYCYCGIRLRRLSCAAAGTGQGKWAPRGELARRLKKNCARPGLAGCSLCLRTLNQLKAAAGNNNSSKDRRSAAARGNDCQLMGLTWLLSMNRTRYFPAAAAVLRSFMVEEGGAVSSDGEVRPTCRQISDEMPIAVGSSEIGEDSFSSAGELPPAPELLVLMAHILSSAAFFLGQ